MGHRAAFFDLDKTLIPGSSLFLLARGLYARDYYRVRDIARFALHQMRFRLSGENTRGIDATNTAAAEFVVGRTQEEMREMGREIAEERVLPRVYEGIAKVIEHHRLAGDLTFLATAAPKELAEIVAEGLGMTGAIGSKGEVTADGHYTGRLEGDIVHGPAKAAAVESLAHELDIDLGESYAYSDSVNDLPLLELIGHPNAVNPDTDLKEIARHRGWPVFELRTRRRALLVGVPSIVAAAGLFGGGVALGSWLGRRTAHREVRDFLSAKR